VLSGKSWYVFNCATLHSFSAFKTCLMPHRNNPHADRSLKSLSSLRLRLVGLVLLAVIPALILILHNAAQQRRETALETQENLLRLTRLAATTQRQQTEAIRQLLITFTQLPPVRSGDWEQCNRLLADLNQQFPNFLAFSVTAPNGDLQCSSLPITRPVNFSDRLFFQLTRETLGFAVGDYQVGRLSGRESLSFGYPILDQAGRLRSVVSAGLDLEKLNRVPLVTPLPEGAVVVVVDRNSTVLLQSPSSEQWVGKSFPYAQINQKVLTQAEGTIEARGIDGVERLYAFSRLGDDPVNSSLSIRIGLPTSVAFARADQMLAQNLISLGGVTLLALAAAWFGGDLFLVRRVKSLVQTTERLRQGDLAARTDFSDGGELGQLARSVDSMASTLEQRQQAIDRLTDDLQHQLTQLQAARTAAENANRIKDEFLAVLSHELRTPMNPILGWAKMLRGGKLSDAKTTLAIETIERNAQIQVQLIDDLLDISRILQSKLNLSTASVSLSTVTRAAIETVRLAAEAKAIVIQPLFSSSDLMVQGDAGRLQQVIWNLLSNAVKFTPKGGQIELELSQVGSYAQIRVKDNGKGIKPEFLPYVFDHFRQEDGATTRKFGGMGLGLAIARQIVELHGGQIRVESPGENQGATFTVQIPLTAQTSNPAPENLSTSAQDLSGLRILVVDDEPDSRDFVAFVLEDGGAIVTRAASGSKALQQIKQSAFDLIVSDIGMPDMDGYQLMEQVRSQGQQVSAIAVTAYAGEYDRQQALQAGFQRHLSKPVDPEALMREIVALIRSQDPEPVRSRV
jgi:signal transduction histidine kinase/ActR/RegA family two-component response regulator